MPAESMLALPRDCYGVTREDDVTDLLENARHFSESGYRALIQCLKNIGYEDVLIEEIDETKHHIFLRHDVDLCLERAAEMALIEREEGVRSTYYILLNTEFYNSSSQNSRKCLQIILSCGHAIGLHFDAARYPSSASALEKAASDECAILESIIQAPVTSISFHRPAKKLLGRDSLIAGRAHAYEPRFFDLLAYFADSQGSWRYGHPLDDAKVRSGRALQLVTHPIWWLESGKETISKLESFRCRRALLLRQEMAHNLKPFAEKFGSHGEGAPPI